MTDFDRYSLQILRSATPSVRDTITADPFRDALALDICGFVIWLSVCRWFCPAVTAQDLLDPSKKTDLAPIR